MTEMKRYKAIKGHIMELPDNQICVVVASNCTAKMRNKIAKYAVEKLNNEERRRAVNHDGQ